MGYGEITIDGNGGPQVANGLVVVVFQVGVPALLELPVGSEGPRRDVRDPGQRFRFAGFRAR
ncbi:hypothetical protein KKG45_02305, partial [bacterium]|nr:hypothetical protein [bacterium]